MGHVSFGLPPNPRGTTTASTAKHRQLIQRRRPSLPQPSLPLRSLIFFCVEDQPYPFLFLRPSTLSFLLYPAPPKPPLGQEHLQLIDLSCIRRPRHIRGAYLCAAIRGTLQTIVDQCKTGARLSFVLPWVEAGTQISTPYNRYSCWTGSCVYAGQLIRASREFWAGITVSNSTSQPFAKLHINQVRTIERPRLAACKPSITSHGSRLPQSSEPGCSRRICDAEG